MFNALHGKAKTKEYFQRYDIDRLIEDIVYEIVLNQPINPKKHIYDFLGRALGIPKGLDDVSLSEKEAGHGVCSIRIFLEQTGRSGRTERHFHRSAAGTDLSDTVLNLWKSDAITYITDSFEALRSKNVEVIGAG